ncbi:zinc finger X-linked protein ZXDB-like [Daphnia pulicaria]|uniref:zinc finger X-linked protein ZXDB-like n=1 Tax=Daphnia pulicaria TaxID=35523 RepID=UPI001EEA7A52|nr:zinc finger X-linked protein ZXDB-like [Daphnia pulicaria]
MERWFKTDNELASSMEYDQIGLSSEIRSAPDALVISNDFSHCLGEKLPLELLTTDEEGVPNIIELEVQLDDKCFNTSHEETAVLSTEETILFEEVRDTPNILHQDERENLMSLQSKVIDIVEEKIMLLTPHELESMKVSALESDSEKESQQSKVESGPSDSVNEVHSEKIPKPIVVLHENETLYLCPFEECSKGFSKLFMAKSHIMTHVGIRQFKCDAEGCSWSFFSEYKLKRHKECHQGKKDFACTVCRRKFTTLYNLNSHKKLHDRPNIYSCSIEQCSSEFQTQRELDNHLKEQHREVEAPYACHHCNCGKRFHSLNALTTHLRSHTRVGPLICQWEGCSRSFDRPSHLESHLRTHTGDRPFVCHFEGCGWAFRTPSKLSRHQRTHKNERPFKCPHQECHKAYLRSEHLKQHLLSQHRGMKMFRCPVENCGAEFTARSTLYVHAKRHNVDTANLTFPCEHPGCNKQYSGKSNLRKHMVRCHGNRSTPCTATVSPTEPPELIKVIDQPIQNDYIALLLGDDEEQMSADRSVVTFLAVPTDSLQDTGSGSNGDSNVCVLLHTGGGSHEASTSSTGHAHIVWSWQTSPVKTGEECSEFSQSTINMRDLE